VNLEEQFLNAMKQSPYQFPDDLVMKHLKLARLFDESPQVLGLHILMLGIMTDYYNRKRETDTMTFNEHLDAIYECLEGDGFEFEWGEEDEDDDE